MLDATFWEAYQTVRPTVFRLKQLYRLRLWTSDDWEQEAGLVLYQLLQAHPDLVADEARLRVYFKTKFSNYVKDMIRRQESQKRQFNRMDYEDIQAVAYMVPSREMPLDDYVLFYQGIRSAKLVLSTEEGQQLDCLLAGEIFKGRKQLLRKLRPFLA